MIGMKIICKLDIRHSKKKARNERKRNKIKRSPKRLEQDRGQEKEKERRYPAEIGERRYACHGWVKNEVKSRGESRENYTNVEFVCMHSMGGSQKIASQG